ncbi:hypothetical protein HYV82_06830 [Candidatus Woesearchaeota archaeon]|nr:hypothetical protein [Candidatus Woesearchaeota archaeon]
MPFADIFDKQVFERAKKLPDMYPEPFLALEEYDRTRKLKKWSNKIRANFTIDRNALRQFRRLCEEKGQKMSSLVEKMIKEKLVSAQMPAKPSR